MKRDRFLHVSLNFTFRSSRRDASRKVWRVRRVTGRRPFDHDQVLHGFNPACFKTLFSVPGATSSPGFPATVTSPGFDACLNCRCEPRWRTTTQRSSSSILTTSRIFTIARAAWPFYRAILAPFWTIKTAQICGAKARNDAFPTAALRRIDLARKQRHREPWRERPQNRRGAASRGANRGRGGRPRGGTPPPRFLTDRESEPPFGRHKTPPALLDRRRAQVIAVTTYIPTMDAFERLTTDIAARGYRFSQRGSRRCGPFVYALDPLSARTEQAVQGGEVAI
jgi:hypothetical protein